MQHIDEHTLELYVLGSEAVVKRRQEIEAHVAECNGCRDLVARMTEFYRTAGIELKTLAQEKHTPSTAIARVPHEVERLYQPTAPAIPLRPVTRIERFGMFVRRHPLMVIGGSFSFVAAFGLILGVNLKEFNIDRNPAEYHFDFSSRKLQVLNESTQLLWEKPSQSIVDKGDHATYLARTTKIVDLDQDGISEVLTTLRFFNEQKDSSNALQLIDGYGAIIWKRSFPREIPNTRNRVYRTDFSANEVIPWNTPSGAIAIVLGIVNLGRSPSMVLRLDNKGNEIGAYWHFGGLSPLRMRRFMGKDVLLAHGMNDMNDTTRGEFPILVLLDPAKIARQKRATTSSIFPLPESDAEVMYIRFPHSDMDSVLQSGAMPSECVDGPNGSLFFQVASSTSELPTRFMYVLDSTMAVVEVKSDNGNDRTHEELRRQGKISSILDHAYRENMRKGVRYWDGKEWQLEATMVKH